MFPVLLLIGSFVAAEMYKGYTTPEQKKVGKLCKDASWRSRYNIDSIRYSYQITITCSYRNWLDAA